MLPENGLAQKLQLAKDENRPLVIKLGFDPTAPDLHLGHAVVLKKLKAFQDAGHEVVIVIGSFTARIGDPTGKNKSRPPLSEDVVAENARTYVNQLSKILDIAKCRIVYNGDWLSRMGLADMIQWLSKVTVAQMMHRTDFNKRFRENTPIAMHELTYPILQGLDSVHIKADIEMGGTDQLFNCTMGRHLQEAEGLPAQLVMCMPLLKGLDGKDKMSKSLNNIIGLTDAPNEMFGKMMSVPDAILPEYVQLVTDWPEGEKGRWLQLLAEGENPMLLKKAIAGSIISQYHCDAAAAEAALFFQQQFQSRAFKEKHFEQVPLHAVGVAGEQLSALDLCALLKKDESRSALKRLIEGGGVWVNNERVTDAYARLRLERLVKIRIGKRGYFEVV